MDSKTHLLNLIRIACLHKIQRNFDKATVAFDNALMFWAQSGLPTTDWEELEWEYHACHHFPEKIEKEFALNAQLN